MQTLKDWLRPQVIWFVLGGAFMLLEFVSPGVVILFFGVGAWLVALLCLFFPLSLNLQLTIFLVSSVVLLVVFRSRLARLLKRAAETETPLDDTLDDFVGKRAVVTEKIAPNVPGKVEFRGTYWEAEADAAIPKGAHVQIVAKDNITLKVKPT